MPFKENSFSSAYLFLRCLGAKVQGECFTNRVEKDKLKSFYSLIQHRLKEYSQTSLKLLEQQEICHLVKDVKVKGKLAAIFQAVGYKEKWCWENIYLVKVYKFRVTKSIRLFAFYENNIFHLLLWDPNHLVEPDDKYGASKNFTCTWCLKSCDG